MHNIIIFLTLLVLTSCSTDKKSKNDSPFGCQSGIVAKWSGLNQNDSIELRNDETFSYVGVDGCKSSGGFNCPNSETTNGNLKLSIDNSENSEFCNPAGDYVCIFELVNDQFMYDCGVGQFIYTKS